MLGNLSLLRFTCSVHVEKNERILTASGNGGVLLVLIIALVALAVGILGLFIAVKALREAKSANKNSDLSEFSAAFDTLEPSDKEKVMQYIEEIKGKHDNQS